MVLVRTWPLVFIEADVKDVIKQQRPRRVQAESLMRLTCWSDQRVVQSGHGAGLPLSQPHSDLLLDSPGFGPRVRRWAVRGNHVCGAGRGRLQSRQKAALRHSYAHLWRWFGAAGGTKVRLRAAVRRARWMNASAPVSAVKWRLVGL